MACAPVELGLSDESVDSCSVVKPTLVWRSTLQSAGRSCFVTPACPCWPRGGAPWTHTSFPHISNLNIDVTARCNELFRHNRMPICGREVSSVYPCIAWGSTLQRDARSFSLTAACPWRPHAKEQRCVPLSVQVVDEGLCVLCRQQRANLLCVTIMRCLAKLIPCHILSFPLPPFYLLATIWSKCVHTLICKQGLVICQGINKPNVSFSQARSLSLALYDVHWLKLLKVSQVGSAKKTELIRFLWQFSGQDTSLTVSIKEKQWMNEF